MVLRYSLWFTVGVGESRGGVGLSKVHRGYEKRRDNGKRQELRYGARSVVVERDCDDLARMIDLTDGL